MAAKVRPERDVFQRLLHEELGCTGLASSTAMVGQHTDIVPLKSVAKSEMNKGGKYLDTQGRIGIYDGKELKCEHGKQRSRYK